MTYQHAPGRNRTYNLNAQGGSAPIPICGAPEGSALRFPVIASSEKSPERQECATNVQPAVLRPDASRMLRFPIERTMSVALRLALGLTVACGRAPGAPEKACHTQAVKVPVINTTGQTVSVVTVLMEVCQ